MEMIMFAEKTDPEDANQDEYDKQQNGEKQPPSEKRSKQEEQGTEGQAEQLGSPSAVE